jgi:DTW domain-containing protein
MDSTPKNPLKADCPRCRKPEGLCICDRVRTHPSPLKILVVQHPQEPDKDLGSAWLAVESLEGARLKVGLSWPNLAKAWGDPVDPSRWGILYLGSGPQEPPPPGLRLFWTDKKGRPKTAEESLKLLSELEGLVFLDGTWSQAKALWWRNPWVLKLKRLMLNPEKPSLYRELRKEPRKECLSTLESIAAAIESLDATTQTPAALRSSFEELLNRYRVLKKGARKKS